MSAQAAGEGWVMILTLENQVCSLESAKRLKELGFRQESLFYWSCLGTGWSRYRRSSIIGKTWRKQTRSRKVVYSAYTTAELGILLPEYFRCERTLGAWIVSWGDGLMKELNEIQPINNEANCRAKMLIYLVENKLIEAKP